MELKKLISVKVTHKLYIETLTLCLALLFFLSGCTVLTPPRENPFLSQTFKAKPDEESSFGMAATDANRRVAILNIISGQICVEPPPEAANTISEAFSALFEADVKDKGNLASSLSQSISQNISQLYRRTQTVQLYRDAVFSLCQSAINGSIVVDDTTLAPVPVDIREKIAVEIEAIDDTEIFKEQLQEIKETGLVNLRSLDAIKFRAENLRNQNKNKEAENLEIVANTLGESLRKAEFRRRLEDGLREAFDVLKMELPLFYETEKLRFIVEIGKPTQVCTTETNYADDGTTIESKTVTCDTKVAQDIDKIINEYIKAFGKSVTP